MLSGIQAPWQVQLQARARLAEGTQGAPRKMRRQGAATPEATHRVSVGVAPSIRLPRQPRTAPLRRLPPHRSPWRRQFARHPGSTAENAAAGRSNPGVHSPGVCGMCPQKIRVRCGMGSPSCWQFHAVQSCITFALLKSTDVEKPVWWLSEFSHARGVQLSTFRFDASQSSSSSSGIDS